MSNRQHRRGRVKARRTLLDAKGARLTGHGKYQAMTTFTELEPKIGAAHRWIATAGYVLTDAQVVAAYSGARVNLPVERLFTFGVGCVDCELEYDQALAREPCAAPEWTKGDAPRTADAGAIDESIAELYDDPPSDPGVLSPLEYEAARRGDFDGPPETERLNTPRPRDPRIVYGARCFWWDSIFESGTMPPRPGEPADAPPGLPCCPHCYSVLFEAPDYLKWLAGNQEAIDAGRAPADHLDLLRWSRGKCFPSAEAAREAWLLDTA